MEGVIVPDVKFEDLKFEQEIGAGGLHKQAFLTNLDFGTVFRGKWKELEGENLIVNKYCSCYQTNNGYAKWVSK